MVHRQNKRRVTLVPLGVTWDLRLRPAFVLAFRLLLCALLVLASVFLADVCHFPAMPQSRTLMTHKNTYDT